MYRVLIVSDSHSMKDELNVIKKRHNADVNIHCGDSELTKDSVFMQNFITVRGNCDWEVNFKQEEIIDHGGARFLVTHGHLFGVKMNLLQLRYRALEVGANIICYGHSHIVNAEKDGTCLFINPGSIRSPRFFQEPSYCVLEWESLEEVHIQFYHANGEPITHFPFKDKINLLNT